MYFFGRPSIDIITDIIRKVPGNPSWTNLCPPHRWLMVKKSPLQLACFGRLGPPDFNGILWE